MSALLHTSSKVTPPDEVQPCRESGLDSSVDLRLQNRTATTTRSLSRTTHQCSIALSGVGMAVTGRPLHRSTRSCLVPNCCSTRGQEREVRFAVAALCGCGELRHGPRSIATANVPGPGTRIRSDSKQLRTKKSRRCNPCFAFEPAARSER
jgi:hypothetical protein